MTKVAITGADGFIGSYITKRLQGEDVEITVFDYEKHKLLESETLKDFVEGKDVIIHLAGANRSTNFELIQTNTLGTASLLEAVTKYSPQARIVFASTFQVYLPNSLYGLSKRFAEDLLNLYNQNNNIKQQGCLQLRIKSTILRLSNVYGPGGKPFYNSVIATFAHLIKQGEKITVNGDGSQERDYVYVEDVADAFTKAALFKQKQAVETVDICTNESTSLKEVLDIIASVYPKKFEVVYNSSVKEKPWPTKDKNFSRAETLFGWKPKTSIEEGLRKVMEAK